MRITHKVCLRLHLSHHPTILYIIHSSDQWQAISTTLCLFQGLQHNFLQPRQHVARVVDEAGGQQGVVEELLGDDFGRGLRARLDVEQLHHQGVARVDLQLLGW